MSIPLSILVAALAAAAVTAYGADPMWMAYPHGLQVIMLSRSLQGPLLGVALLGCAAVIAMVAAGGWRAAWLIGLAPILALFAHRFATDPSRLWQVDADASFTTSDQASFVHKDDSIVGVVFDGQAYAYPYSVLYQSPVVAQAKPRRRLLLFWSPFANRAVCVETDWNLKPRELEVVSMPANALLVYNNELGEFINGLTGLTPSGAAPTGFLGTLPTAKMSLGQWEKLHPDTLVLSPLSGWSGGPAQPVMPRYPMPGHQWAGTKQVALIEGQNPTAIEESKITDGPMNVVNAVTPMLVFRGGDGKVKAFVRQANGDLTPRFYPAANWGGVGGMLSELDSNSSWNSDGRAVAGPLKGEKLKPMDVDDGVYLDVIRCWYPNLAVIVPTAADMGRSPRALVGPTRKTHRRHRRPASVELMASAQPTASF